MDPLASTNYFSKPSVAIFRSAKAPVASQCNSSEIQVKSIASQHFCDQCGESNARSLCGRCRLVSYCNADCQKVAWQMHHKKICVPIDQPEKYKILDGLGFTPLHYAALYQRQGTLAQAQQALLDTVKDVFNGTPADLKSYLEPVSDGEISLQMKVGEQIITLTQAEFFKLTGVHFKDGYVVESPKALIQLHSEPPPSSLFIDWIFKPYDPQTAIAKFENEPASVFLAEEPSMGLGLQAGQDFKKGSIICYVGGEFTEKERNNYRAVMYRVPYSGEQDRFLGKGALINDGPPNCVFTPIKAYKGIPQYMLVVALRDISEGEFLHVDYGHNHDLRGGKYVINEQAYKEVVKYCQGGFVYSPQKVFDSNSSYYLKAMFRYVFNVSSLFIRLHLLEILEVQRTEKLMKHRIVQEKFEYELTPVYYHLYPDVLQAIAKIFKVKQSDAAIVDLIENLLLDLSEAAFFQMLLLMKIDPHLTSASISAYRALGELYEHLYLVRHGTLNGSYSNKEDRLGEEKPNFHLDVQMIIAKYSTLPPLLKESFKLQMQDYISQDVSGKRKEIEEIQSAMLKL